MKIFNTESVTLKEFLTNDSKYIISASNDNLELNENQLNILFNEIFGNIGVLDSKHNFNNSLDSIINNFQDEKRKSEDPDKFIGVITVVNDSKNKNEYLVINSQEVLLVLIRMLISITRITRENPMTPSHLNDGLEKLLSKLNSDSKFAFQNENKKSSFVNKKVQNSQSIYGEIALQNIVDKAFYYVNIIKDKLVDSFPNSINKNVKRFEVSACFFMLEKLLSLKIRIVNDVESNYNPIIPLLKQKMGNYDWFKDLCYSSSDTRIKGLAESTFSIVEGTLNVSMQKIENLFNLFDQSFGLAKHLTISSEIIDGKFSIFKLKMDFFSELSRFWDYFEDEKFTKAFPNVMQNNLGLNIEKLLLIKIFGIKNKNNGRLVNFIFSILFWLFEMNIISEKDFSNSSNLFYWVQVVELIFNNEWGSSEQLEKILQKLSELVDTHFTFHERSNEYYLSSSSSFDDKINLDYFKAILFDYFFYDFKFYDHKKMIATSNDWIIEFLKNNIHANGPMRTLFTFVIALPFLNKESQKELPSAFDFDRLGSFDKEHLISRAEINDDNKVMIMQPGNVFIVDRKLNDYFGSSTYFCKNENWCLEIKTLNLTNRKCKFHTSHVYLAECKKGSLQYKTTEIITKLPSTFSQDEIQFRNDELFESFKNKILLDDKWLLEEFADWIPFDF